MPLVDRGHPFGSPFAANIPSVVTNSPATEAASCNACRTTSVDITSPRANQIGEFAFRRGSRKCWPALQELAGDARQFKDAIIASRATRHRCTVSTCLVRTCRLAASVAAPAQFPRRTDLERRAFSRYAATVALGDTVRKGRTGSFSAAGIAVILSCCH